MSRYVVMLTDDEQGYQDVEVLGSFASHAAATAFAEKAQAALDRYDDEETGGTGQFSAIVSRVNPALIRSVREWVNR